MNASKTLIAAIAAATIVGTVGFVSAQTTDANAPAAQSAEPMPNPTTGSQDTPPAAADMSAPPYVAPDTSAPAATSDTAAPSSDASTPATAPSSDSAMPAEPAPKADRN